MSGELCTSRGSDGTMCLYGAGHAVPCKYGRADDIEAQCEDCDCASSRHDRGVCGCGCRRMRWAGRLTSRDTDRSSNLLGLADDVGYVRRGLLEALGEIPAEKVPPAFRPRLCRHGKALCETCDANPPRLHLVGTEEPLP